VGEATVFWRKKKTFLRVEFRNLLNIGKSVLKLEIIWKSDYAHLYIKVIGKS